MFLALQLLISVAFAYLQSWLFSRDMRNAKALLNLYTLATTWRENNDDSNKLRLECKPTLFLVLKSHLFLQKTWTWSLQPNYLYCSVVLMPSLLLLLHCSWPSLPWSITKQLFLELELTIYCNFLSFRFYAKIIIMINNIFSQRFMKENCIVSILPVRQ